MNVRRGLERLVNGTLEPLGVKLMRREGPPTIGGRRMSDEDVIRDARRRGVSPGVYLEALFGRTGRADEIVRRMRAAGALTARVKTVCEIGPGSGLYIPPVLEHGDVERYEIYEISGKRTAYLAATFPVTAREADGERLSATASHSIDLVHAHGVFVTLDFLTVCAYLRETERVLAPGGHAVFDFISEACLDDSAIASWLATPLRYPSLHSRDYIVRYFTTRGFAVVDEFAMPLLVHGTSQYLILRAPGGTP